MIDKFLHIWFILIVVASKFCILTENIGQDEIHEDFCGRRIIKSWTLLNEMELSRGAFPWLATILKQNGEYICSGTLVTTQKIVTTTSCFKMKYSPRDLFVWLGGHDMKYFLEDEGFIISVKEIHIHPQWKSKFIGFDNDIAVLVLRQQIEPSDYIQPICLTDTASISTIADGIIVGYGSDKNLKERNQLAPRILSIPIHSKAECLKKNLLLSPVLTDSTFCGGRDTGVSICNGDIGSGLFVTDGDRFYLRGIVQGLIRATSCDVNTLSIFVNVLKFIDWIRNIKAEPSNDAEPDQMAEQVTLWAPNKVYDEKDYNVIVLSSGIDKRTEVALQFRRSFGTVALVSDTVQRICVSNNEKSFAKKEFELFMTLHRNESTSTGISQMCMTKILQKIEAEKRQFYTFIQTDKPMYKPGDTVRFRVVVVDRDLKPYYMNNINITVTDSLNRPIKKFDDVNENFMGVFTGNFSLNVNTPLGIWKIRAVMDKIEQWEVFKEIAVQKFTLPPFAAYINTKDRHLLTNSVLQLSFYAKYSFEDFVRGNAQLTITCTTNNKVVLTKSFSDITGIHNAKFKVHEDLKATTTTKLDYEATIVFTETESGISANKTVKFMVHADNSPKIRPNYEEKFMPGLPFGVKFIIVNWKDELIKKSHEKVTIKFKFGLSNGQNQTNAVHAPIEDGIAKYDLVVPDDANELSIRVDYINVNYEKMIEKGPLNLEVNKRNRVDHLPKNPNYGDVVNIYVRDDSELDQLVAVVISRHGNIESHQVYCHFRKYCKFNITIRKDMMPEAKVVIYDVQERANIYQGETTITTVKLGRNTLDIKLPESAQKGKKVDMEITTKPASTVYLLGFDKRLTDMFQGNEIRREDVIKELADYDGTNKIDIFDMNTTNWHECTEKELKRIDRGRKFVVEHSGADFSTNLIDDMEKVLEGQPESDRHKRETKISIDDGIREDSGEVWLFEEFVVPDGEITKTFMIPDSIASWVISSFSMNEEYGLAISPPKELIVKN